MIGDMHCHSNLSDGSTHVDRIVEYAVRAGMDFISLSDHDTMDGVQRAVSLGKKAGLEVVPGLEISTVDGKTGRNAHLLCYLPKYPDKLLAMTSHTLASRREQAECVLQEVRKHYPVTKADVERAADGSTTIYRQHIMRALMEQGYSQAVFTDFFKEVFSSIPYKVELPDVRDAAKLVREAGGVAVLAHPGWYDSLELAEELAKSGAIQGIELSHPRNTDEDKKAIMRLINEYALVPTGGSDYHGFYTSNPHPIGTCTMPGEALELLRRIREGLNGRL